MEQLSMLYPSPEEIVIPVADAHLRLFTHWCNAELAEQWFSQLCVETPWERLEVNLYGQKHPMPRLVSWVADPGVTYGYSGMVHANRSWTPLLAEIRQRVEACVGQPFNGVLLNLYRNGQDSMGWHSDDEPELGTNPLIASLNLGATRRFDLRRKGATAIEHSIELPSGSLLVMAGTTQHYWQHQVAKSRRVLAPRLNLTFRLVQI